jgi:hypothetical protein
VHMEPPSGAGPYGAPEPEQYGPAQPPAPGGSYAPPQPPNPEGSYGSARAASWEAFR